MLQIVSFRRVSFMAPKGIIQAKPEIERSADQIDLVREWVAYACLSTKPAIRDASVWTLESA